MYLNEFSVERAEKINKTTMPDLDFPLNLKILWIENVDKQGLLNDVIKQSHKHTFYEIHFVFKGNISYECNNTHYKLSANKALIIPSLQEHRYISCSKDILKTAIAFSGDETVSNIVDKKAWMIDFGNDVYENFNHILKQTESNNVFVPYIIAGRTIEILYSVFEKLSADLPKFENNPHDPRFLVAKDFIAKHINKNISCTDVANECCLSAKQLNRIFKIETKKSISEYINQTKVKQAKKLLLDNHRTIKEICFELGFENESSFISFFKRQCSLTPGSFRKQMSEK